jgi:hypothetical protein
MVMVSGLMVVVVALFEAELVGVPGLFTAGRINGDRFVVVSIGSEVKEEVLLWLSSIPLDLEEEATVPEKSKRVRDMS